MVYGVGIDWKADRTAIDRLRLADADIWEDLGEVPVGQFSRTLSTMTGRGQPRCLAGKAGAVVDLEQHYCEGGRPAW